MTAKTEAKELAGGAMKLADRIEQSGHCWCLEKTNRKQIVAALRRAALTSPAAPRTAVMWRHKKRGSIYVEVARGPLQAATRQPAEDDVIVCYRGADGRYFFREASEFEDGRFERINTASPPPAADAAGLREALQEIADTDQYPDHEDTASELREIARNALAAAPSLDLAEANQFQSSDGGVESRHADSPLTPDAKIVVGSPERRLQSGAGVAPGPSEAITDPAEVRRAAIEECARIAEQYCCLYAATKIRALAPEGKPVSGSEEKL